MIKLRMWASVKIKVTGLNLKYVLDTAREKGITLFSVKRTDGSSLEISLSRKGAGELVGILPKETYRTEILNKNGLFFKLVVLKGRYALFSGILIFTALMMILSRHTWLVKVYGCEESKVSAIVSTAENAGAIGNYGSIDTDRIAQAVTDFGEDIIWSSVRVKGIFTEVYVKIKPQREEETVTDRIVASKDGRILSLTVTGGTAEVEDGETVLKGQTLISGRQKIGETEYPVNASGKAVAEVWYYASEEKELNTAEYTETGREETVTGFSLFGINVSPKPSKFKNYREEKEQADTHFLPIKIYRITYRETEEKQVTPNIEMTAKETAEEIEKKIRMQIPTEAKIKNKKYGYEEKDGVLYVWAYAEAVEDIAQRG